MVNKLLVVFLVVMVGLNLFLWRTMSQQFQMQTITVNGYAERGVPYESASLSITLATSNAKKDIAESELKSKSSLLLVALKSLGVSDQEIKQAETSSFLVDGIEMPSAPNSSWNAQKVIKIDLTDTTKVADIVNMVNSYGAYVSQGPDFVLTKANSYRDELLKEAMENAKVKAMEMAESSGSRLGKMMFVNEDTPPADKMGTVDQQTQSLSGVAKIEKYVSVSWTIK